MASIKGREGMRVYSCFEDGKFVYPRMLREGVNSWSEMCVEEACMGEKGGWCVRLSEMESSAFMLGEGVDRELRICK